MEENQNLVELYNALHKKGVTAASNVSEFKMLLDDEKNRQDMYDALNKKGVFSGTYDEFQTSIGYELNQQPAPERVDVSDVERSAENGSTVAEESSIPTVTMEQLDQQQVKYPFPSYVPVIGQEPAKSTTATATPEAAAAIQTVDGKTQYDFSPDNVKGMMDYRAKSYETAFSTINELMPEIERSIRDRAYFDTDVNNRNKDASRETLELHANKLAEQRLKYFRGMLEKDGVAGLNADKMNRYLAFSDEELRGKVAEAFTGKDAADRYMQAYYASPEGKAELTAEADVAKAMLEGIRKQHGKSFWKSVGGMLEDIAIGGAIAEGGIDYESQKQLMGVQEDIRRRASVDMAISQNLHEAENAVSLAAKNMGEGKGNVFVQFGRGVRYANLDKLIPVSDLYGQMGVLQLYDKLDENGNPKEPLTEDEQTLYEALAANQYVAQRFGGEATMLNRIGSGLPEQAMFTLSFFLSSEFAGAQAIGKGAARMARKAASGAVKREVKSGVGRFIIDVALPGTFGMAVETAYRTGLQVPSIAANAIERHVGSLRIDPETGEVGGFENGADWGEAVWKSVLSAANENATELVGDKIFEPGFAWLGRNTKAGRKIADFRKVIGAIGEGRVDDMLEMLNGVSEKAGWAGFEFETLEEMVGNFNDAAFIHDQTWEQAFSSETIMETTLNCLIFGMVMGSGNTAKQAVLNMPSDVRIRNAKREASAVIGKMDGISTEEIDSHMGSDTGKQLADWLVEKSKRGNTNGDWTEAQRAAVANYVKASIEQKAKAGFRGMQLKEDVAEMEAEVDGMTNNQSGDVIEATFDIDGDERKGTVIGGRVSAIEDESTDTNGNTVTSYGYNPYLSSATLSVLLDDGTKKMIAARSVKGVTRIVSAEQYKAERMEELKAGMMQSVADMERHVSASYIWGSDLQDGAILPYNGGFMLLKGKTGNGQWLLVECDLSGNPLDGKQPVAVDDWEFRKAGMTERLRMMQETGAPQEEIDDAIDDIETEQAVENVEKSGDENNIWDAIAGFMSGYVKTNAEGDFVVDESRPEAAAGYLVALQKGDIAKAVSIVDARLDELTARLAVKPEAVVNGGEGVVSMAANESLADDAAAEMQELIDFLTAIRDGLEEKRAEHDAMRAMMPVSQMEVGQEFPVMYDGQQAMAVVVGKDADGRNVLTIRDQDGNDLESGIDDWEDEQWDAVRVKAEDSSVAEEPEPVGKGSFGYIYDQFRGKAKEAVEFLIKKKSGEAIGALSHRSVGEIDIVWGDEGTGKSDGFGLAKLVKYHPDVIGNLQELLDDMEVVSRSENRVNLESKTHKAGVRLDWDGVRKTWLMTMFEKKGASEPANGTTDITGNQSGLENDTAPFQNPDVSAGKDNANSDTTGENGVKNSIPRDKDGNIAHASLDRNDAETYAAAVSEEADNAEAFAGMGDPDYIKRNLDAAGKEVEKAEKRKPKATNASKLRDELSEINRQKQSAKAMVAFWNAVDAERKRRQAVRLAERQAADDERHARALAEEEARKAENARKKAEQEQLGANNVSDNIREKWNNSTKIEGNADEITLANGERIEGHYYLVESGSASASHDATEGFKKTEGFPVDENGQTVNDRDYEGDMNAQQITRTMAQNYDSRAAQEAPVVSQDGIVMSGNGRTMAGELAALNNTDGAYIEYLNKYPHKYGFTTEQVGGMSHPRVVFVPNERMPYTTDTFAKFNQQGMKGQSKTEQAVKLGKIVDDATFGRIIRSINRFDTLGDFYADSNATAEAIGELQKAGAINQMQHTEMFDGETISETGKQMLENMLIGKAFESNPDAVRQLAAYKSLRQSVITALAEISNNIALGEYSLESELSQAIELAYNARSKGYKAGDKVSEFAGQTVLFAEDGATAADFTNATVMMLADLLNDNRVTRLKKALQVYNNQAVQSAAGQMDLFSGDVKTKEQILDEVLLLLQNGTEQEQQEALDTAREQRKAEAGIQQDGDAGQVDTSGGTEPESGLPDLGGNAEEGLGLSEEEADDLISQMEDNADAAEEIKLTPENWLMLFGENGEVETPIGVVKMGENQYLKFAQKGRDGKLGLSKPTLERPDVIIEDKAERKDGKEHERESSFVFVKVFRKKDGSRYYYFTSVTVRKEGREVVVSNQEKSPNRISRLLQEGEVAWIDGRFNLHPTAQTEESVPLGDSNRPTSTDNQPAKLGIGSLEPEAVTPPALEPGTNTDSSGVDSGHKDGVTAPAGNSPATSGGKGTEKSETTSGKSGNEEKGSEKSTGVEFEFDVNTPYGKDGTRYVKAALSVDVKKKGNAWLRKQRDKALENGNVLYYTLNDKGDLLGISGSVDEAYQRALDADEESFHIVRLTKGDGTYKFNYSPGYLFGDWTGERYGEDGWLKQEVKESAKNEIRSNLGEDVRKETDTTERKTLADSAPLSLSELRGETEQTKPTDEAVAAANEEVDTNPTEAQKEAGNYKKGHVTIDGFDISIENPAGSTRSGTDAQGNPWSVTMHNSYGYIRMTEGVDGDHIDIFLSDHIDDWNGTVYVVDQVNSDGSFDEHKVMYGFNSTEEAREAYLSNYSEGWQGLGTITGVSREEFKKWVDSSHRKTKAFADYKSVQTTEGQSEQSEAEKTSLRPDVLTGLRDGSREELDKRLMEERRQRILAEGTSFDKPFGLVSVSETMTAEDIEANVGRIVQGLKDNEGSGNLDGFYGFAYQDNFKNNAGNQVHQYIYSLGGVVPNETLQTWLDSHGIKSKEDIIAYGEKLYDNTKKTEPQPEQKPEPKEEKKPDKLFGTIEEREGENGATELFSIDENNTGNNVVTPESQVIFDKAKEIFGTTNDIREAGYILPDGTMLDFSGRHLLDEGTDDSDFRGIRTADHRDISSIAYEKDGDTETGIETDMSDFIRRGAIRVDDNAGVINLAVKPTKEQKSALSRIIEHNDGYVQVDFGDGFDTEHYVGYEAAMSKRVLNDIDKYFNEGVKPNGNVMFLISREDWNERVIAGQDLRDEANSYGHHPSFNHDYTVNLVHGTSEENTEKIRKEGLQKGSYLAQSEEESRQHVSAKRKNNVFIVMKVDARDISYNGATNEYYAEDGLVMDEDGVWVSPQRKARNDRYKTEPQQLAYDAVREALANAGIEVVEATEEDVKRMKDSRKQLKDSKGTIRGWVGNDGKIHLTKDGLNAETPIHEYTHLWAEALQMNNPELWEQIKGLLKGTPEWQRITSMKEYSNLKDDDRLAGEVLAHISGKKNAERMEAEAKRMIDDAPTLEEAAKAANLLGRMRDALKKFWTWVGKTLLGKKGNINIDQVSNMVLADLTNGIDPFNPRGGKRTNRTKRTDASVEGEMERIRREAQASGTFMKAPNGKPTKLSERQWLQVRTQAFRRWFGNWDLKYRTVSVVAAAKEHGFKNFAEAREWAKSHIVDTYTNPEIGEVNISGTAVEKYLSGKAVGKSVSTDVHLSALKVMPNIISNSIVGEIHNDRGGDANIKDVVRLFGAISIDGITYRVKTTVKRYNDKNTKTKAYSYEVTEIELLEGESGASHTTSADSTPTSSNSISAAKLLQNVEKSYEKGKLILDDHSKLIDENGEPMAVWHSYDRENYGSGLVYMSADRSFSEEFGENTDSVFVNLRNPYITDDGILRDAEGNEVMYEGEPAAIGYLDSVPDAYMNWLESNFDGAMDRDGVFIVAFEPNQIKSATENNGDFDAGNPDIRFSIGDETDETDRTDVPEMSDEEAEQYDAGRMTFTEIATEGVIKAAEKNKEDLRMRNGAVKAIGVSLNRLRQAMAKQKEYDKATVDSIVRLARMMIENGYMDNMSRSEVKRLMTLAKNATGKTDITKQANAVVDLMLKHQLKAAEAVQQKLLSTKGSKVNASGVEVQAGLDITGQRTVKAMKEGIELDEAALAERIADVNDRMGGTDKTLAANAAEEYEGLMMAKDYHDMIRQSEQDEAQLRHELDQAKEDVKNGTLGRKEYKELAARIDAALRKNMAERVTAFTRLNQQLAEVINGSKGRAREFREKQMERVREIQHNANSDMKGTPASEHKKAARINKAVNNDIVQFFMLPMATFDEMLRFFGKKSVDGMGYLWQRFMGGYTDAADTEWRSLKKDHDALDEKVSEVMGEKMRWSDLFSMERKMEPIEVEFYDTTTNEEGNSVRVKEKHPLTQGNALYIYMVNKMDDGAMKLRRMGISDEDVDKIVSQLDKRFVQLADWIQDEFLPKKREAFNAVHMRMFGAPMAAIEEYFPLVTNSRSRGKDEDISEHDKGEKKPSTITGSIIKRTVNTTPLDVTNADAFDVLLGHLRDMEHWAAYAEFNRDLNTLLSYKRFKNQVLNTSSVRFGAGETLWNNFKNVCAIAAGVYRPTKARADKLMVNISKGVTSAKISFRLYTALKQLLSYPAYFSEANPIELAKSTGRPANSFNWALDNLPGFAERWQSRQAGDSRLKDTDADWDFWKNKFVDTARRWGMTPNAFVDGITVAMGAKAIYESKLKGYRKAGYSEAEAKERALKEASVAVNETQQSSQNAYLSAMQLDRTMAAVGLTVFRNASMGYTRRLLRAVDNLKRKFTKGYKEESVEFMRKKMVREGLTEEQAKAASERAWRISWVKDVANVVIFGYVMQFIWNLGSNLIYLIFGDDDDEKERMLEDAALHAFAGPVEGLSGGSIISELVDIERKRWQEKKKYGKPITSFRNYDFNLLPIMSDMQTIINRFEQDGVRGIQDIVNLVIQIDVGVNPQTITDAAVAIVDAADGDLGLGKEIGLCALRIMQVPQSQLDQLYIDELGMSAKDAKGLPMDELAQRYAAYKRMKDAPLTGWAYSDEAREKVDKRYVNKFVKLVQERVANMDDEALERNMDDNDDLMLKKQVGKEVASRLEGKDTYGNQPQSNWKEETKKAHLAYQQLRGYVDLCEDVVLQKAQADADKAYESALEEGRWTEAQTQQMMAKGIEQAREQLNKMRRQLGQGNSQYDQQIMENIRAMRSRYMEYYGLKGKKE